MTLQIPYATLKANYSSSDPASDNYVSQADLFAQIGWDEFVGNPNYHNTCAIRVSLALVGAGYPLSAGSHRILAGPNKGKRIEVNMKTLANMLARPAWLGTPEKPAAPNPASAIRGRQGIIAFHGIPGYAGGGHIDLIDNTAASLRCASACYFDSREVWFWPLPQARIA